MRYQGKITNWNDEKGYGFVEPNGGGDRAFVHIKAFSKRIKRPVEGDIIVYSVIKEKDGRYRAADIAFPRSLEKRVRSSKPNKNIFSLSFTLGFCLFLVFATLIGKLPSQLLGNL